MIHFSKAAERSVLQSIFCDPEKSIEALETITADDFHTPKHQKIFRAMLELNSEGEAIESIAVCEKLNNGKLKLDEYVLGLEADAVTAENVDTHTGVVKRESLKRSIVAACREAVEDIRAGEIDPDEISDGLAVQLSTLTNPQSSNALSVGETIGDTIKGIEERSMITGCVGVPTGLYSVDKVLGGFRPGELSVIAARPGAGKTAFALTLAKNASLITKKATLFFSLEMPRDQLNQRLISAQKRINSYRLRDGNIKDQQTGVDHWKDIAEAGQELSRIPLIVDDGGTQTAQSVKRTARQVARRADLGLIVIDYLQLMTGKGNSINHREREIADISRSLKSLSRELGVPIVALSQLNRMTENRPDKRPLLGDLRESGAIEQDADQVVMLYRDAMYNEDSDAQDQCEILIRKNRHGACKTISVYFQPEFALFQDI
jgi:replicative DNA helicase